MPDTPSDLVRFAWALTTGVSQQVETGKLTWSKAEVLALVDRAFSEVRLKPDPYVFGGVLGGLGRESEEPPEAHVRRLVEVIESMAATIQTVTG